MNDTDQHVEILPPERPRTGPREWAAFALLLVFLIVTVALWGYAAWWAVVKLIGLFA